MAREPSPPTQTFTPPGADAEAPLPVHVDAAARAASGGALERYEVERHIGEGGMGHVLLARDPVVGRHVALKQMREPGKVNARARFEREARLQGQLEHPSIVPVYDVGIGKDGAPFFTMKRVRGQSLADVLEDMRRGYGGRFSRRKLLTAFSQLCVAVHYAHERGVVHRDIKPTNVMLGRYGEVYLLDWGVAKLATDRSTDASSDLSIPAASSVHTGAGAVVGSLTGMAPEQAAGAAVDARTDVYALGALLFEILTLEPLHPAGTFEEVAPRIIEGVEARPSVRAPDADVPPELDALCVDSTRVQPGDRTPSALALHEAIERYLDGDRDVELRRANAERHAAAAKAIAEEIVAGRPPEAEEKARVRALRDVGRALAFDPENKEALGTLVKLLTTPPRERPREVVEEERVELRRRMRIGAMAVAVVYGMISVNGWVNWALGFRQFELFLVPHTMWFIAFLLGLVAVWRPGYVSLGVAGVFGIVTSTYITKLYTPYLIVPTFLTVHAALFAFTGSRTLRYTIIGAAALGWTVSVYGTDLGLFPPMVEMSEGVIRLSTPGLGQSRSILGTYLYPAGLIMLVGPAVIVGVLRAAWGKSEEALRMQAWQLRKLVREDREPNEEAGDAEG